MTETPAPTGASSLDDDAVELLLSGRGDPNDPLVAALVELRREAVVRAPEPSAELTRLLTAGDELGSRRRRAGRITLGVVIAATATLTLSGVAAANDLLPGPAQGVVTDVVNDLTPFHIGPDRPAAPPARRPRPADLSPSPIGGSGGPRPAGPAGTGSSEDRSGGAQDTNRRHGRSGTEDGSGSGEGSGSDRRGSGGSRNGSGGDSGGGGSSGDGGADDRGSGGGSGGGGSGSGGGSGGRGSDGGSGGGGSDGGGSGGSGDDGSGGGGSGGGGSGG